MIAICILGLDINDATDSRSGRNNAIGRQCSTRGFRHRRYCFAGTDRQSKWRAFVLLSHTAEYVLSVDGPDRYLVVSGLGDDILHLVLPASNVLNVARDRHATTITVASAAAATTTHNFHGKLVGW